MRLLIPSVLLAVVTLVPSVVHAATGCAELELSTGPFTVGAQADASNALPSQFFAGEEQFIYVRRSQPGSSCAPPMEYQGSSVMALNVTFSYQRPDSGQRRLLVGLDGSPLSEVPAGGLSISVAADDGTGRFRLRYDDGGSVEWVVTDLTVAAPAAVSQNMSFAPSQIVIDEVFSQANENAQTADIGTALTPDATPVFGRAGEAFSVKATVLNRLSPPQPMPNFGPTRDGEQLILRSTLLAPVGNGTAETGRNGREAGNPLTNGVIINGTSWQAVLGNGGEPSGQLVGHDFAFDEVGIIRLSVGLAPQENESVQTTSAVNAALPTNGRYFSEAMLPIANGSRQLRFVPAYLSAEQIGLATFNTFCTLDAADPDVAEVIVANQSAGFTYLGDYFTYADAPTLRVVPMATDGQPVLNYIGDFFRITQQTMNGRRYSAAVGEVETVRLSDDADTPNDDSDDIARDVEITAESDGTATVQFTLTRNIGSEARLLRLVRNAEAPVAPFSADLALTIPVLDADGVSTETGEPLEIGQAAAGAGIPFSGRVVIDGTTYPGNEVRQGRLQLGNNAGNTTDAAAPASFVELPLVAEYFDGAIYQNNDWDSCTIIDAGAAQIVSASSLSGEQDWRPQSQFADPNTSLPRAAMVEGSAKLLYYSGLSGVARIRYNFGATQQPRPLHLVPGPEELRGQLTFGQYQGDIRIVHRTTHSMGVN